MPRQASFSGTLLQRCFKALALYECAILCCQLWISGSVGAAALSSRNAFVSQRRYAANTVSVIGACGPMRPIIHSATLVFERYRIKALRHRPKLQLSIARPRRLISRVFTVVFLSEHSHARLTTPNFPSGTLRICLEAMIAIREIAVD
jgi:hypothetical protein